MRLFLWFSNTVPFSYLFSRPKTAFFPNVDEPKLYKKSRPCLAFVLENELHFISLGGYRTFRRPRKGRCFLSSVRPPPRLISIHFLRSCRCQNDVTSASNPSLSRHDTRLNYSDRNLTRNPQNMINERCLKITEKVSFNMRAKRATFTFWVDKS